MADEPEDELLLDTPIDEQDAEPAETDEISIEIDGDEPVEDTPLIKQLRQRERDLARENAELKRGAAPKTPPDPGKKPDLWEDCEGDPERYDREYDAWKDRKRAVEDFGRRQSEAQDARNHAFERTVATYRGKAAQLGVPDFANVETVVNSALPELLRNAVLQYADDPAKVVYALGKHPARLNALIAEGDPEAGGDPIKFIIGIRDLERNLKVVNRRKPPEPEAETIQRGSAPLSGGMTQASYDKKLVELEKKASSTGQRNEILAFKRQHKGKFS